MALELGLQLYSVRDELAKDFVGTVEKVAEIGYKNIELFFHNENEIEESVGGLKAEELKALFDRLNIKAVSAHIAPGFLHPDKAEGIIQFAKTVGFDSLGIAIAFFKDKQDVLDFCEQMMEAGTLYKQRGLQLYYHNHFQEFQRFDGQYVMDIMLENTDEEIVKVEFDTYWALRGGVDPIKYLKKLGDRCDLLHQKDLPKSVNPVNMFEVVGDDAHIDMDLMVSIHNVEDFTEVGQGVMDIPSIVEFFKSKRAARYLFIEQDWTSRNQLESVKMSYDYMKQFFV